MKPAVLLIFIVTVFSSNAQTIIYQEQFNSSLGTCTTFTSSNWGANWAWSSSCTKSGWTGHSAPGHAIFQGSLCTFGYSLNTVGGELSTPTIALPSGTCLLTFHYSLTNELYEL